MNFFAKASEAEIWTRVRRRYLTSFAVLHFENEPGLTAAEGRRNRRVCVSKMGNGGNTKAFICVFYFSIQHEHIVVYILCGKSGVV